MKSKKMEGILLAVVDASRWLQRHVLRDPTGNLTVCLAVVFPVFHSQGHDP